MDFQLDRANQVRLVFFSWTLPKERKEFTEKKNQLQIYKTEHDRSYQQMEDFFNFKTENNR